jgi:GNAT superfamily N-acetyltransferase
MEGWCLLELPSRDNRHRADTELIVSPERRRRGFGTALLRHAAERAISDGRSLLTGRAWQGSAGEAFARSVGATAGQVDIRRALRLSATVTARWPGLRAAAEAVAAGYSLIRWTSATPEEYLDQVAAVNAAFADAPHDPSLQPERWDAARVRDSERRIEQQRMRTYTMAARHDASGELAGLTRVEVSPELPSWGFQGLTAVVRAHRGHRLGLLLKVAMLEWLAQAEPRLKRVVTGNAETNEHMIAINEALGFKPFRKPVQSWELPAADALRATQS